jgi:hypothetical protein
MLRKVNWGIDGAAKKFAGYRWFGSIFLQSHTNSIIPADLAHMSLRIEAGGR